MTEKGSLHWIHELYHSKTPNLDREIQKDMAAILNDLANRNMLHSSIALDKFVSLYTADLEKRARLAFDCIKEVVPGKQDVRSLSNTDADSVVSWTENVFDDEAKRVLLEIDQRCPRMNLPDRFGNIESRSSSRLQEIKNEIVVELKHYLEPNSLPSKQVKGVEARPQRGPSSSKADERMTVLLKKKLGLNATAKSYIQEAYRTDRAGCFRATAVMVGCAAESLTLELRNRLVSKGNFSKSKLKDLRDLRISIVIDALKREFDSHKSQMPRELRAEHENFWPALTYQIRRVRNDAGHPNPVEKITPSDVERSLNLFTELASLCKDLRNWIKNSYSPDPSSGHPKVYGEIS